ncbi:CDGSH iron-sulfur domain-containing protein [Haladaptatus salinisoli]|uniref:CDGSH iron-sulfur domain-containing protein n=1 Tax=Haladaptatus salinisoli TaxID=2884876 RepID=UPI001D0B76FF|nr:CDGSH iron-sulfur domain-containing protein [Haladaptatus salinisoli]
MAREVRHAATGPLKLDEEDFDDEKGNVALCLCGLSDDYPFCDGTHRATRDEEEGVVYRYEDGERRVVDEIRYADE